MNLDNIKIKIDTTELDTALEKMERLAKLLHEVQQIVDSLSR